MTSILIAYTTNAGSTTETAQKLGAALQKHGAQVHTERLEQVAALEGYDAVIVGAPMILGWSRPARRFVRKHQQELRGRRVAYFATAMSLTDAAETVPVPVFLDPTLAKLPASKGFSIKESFTRVGNYLKAMLAAAPQVQPISVAFLGGRLELFRLKWWQALFVMAVVQAKPGDLRNWDAVEQWAEGLMRTLQDH